ncbi:hypothetical protein niasHT_020560 [Heterodera trifolii]|uniref:Uncharacterized protein n=1 Tax=Heterodera trifolii TaxID=157864 RepID=A0ABD2J9R1_9BILA
MPKCVAWPPAKVCRLSLPSDSFTSVLVIFVLVVLLLFVPECLSRFVCSSVRPPIASPVTVSLISDHGLRRTFVGQATGIVSAWKKKRSKRMCGSKGKRKKNGRGKKAKGTTTDFTKREETEQMGAKNIMTKKAKTNTNTKKKMMWKKEEGGKGKSEERKRMEEEEEERRKEEEEEEEERRKEEEEEEEERRKEEEEEEEERRKEEEEERRKEEEEERRKEEEEERRKEEEEEEEERRKEEEEEEEERRKEEEEEEEERRKEEEEERRKEEEEERRKEEEEERREEEEEGRVVTKGHKREENKAEKAMSRKPNTKGTEKPKEERKRNRKEAKNGKGISGSKGQAARHPFDHFPISHLPFDHRLSQCAHLFRQCRRLPLPLHVPFRCLFRLFSFIFCPYFLRLPLLLLIVVHSSFAQQCPSLQPPCRCAPSVYEPVAIICENAGSLQDALRAAAPAKQFPIDSLSILGTAIPSLPAGAFSDWTILRLVLNRNTLSQIEEGAFDGIPLDSLVELDLSDNSLANIGTKPGGICQLRNMRKLYLNRNGIGQLSHQFFNSLASKELLQKLEFRGNKLTDQSLNEGGAAGEGGQQQGMFGALRNLQELSLETNGLSAVPSVALSAQRGTLTNLNLGLNQIKEVPVGALNFPELTSLSLEFNGLPMIVPHAFQHVPRLQYLYLTGNKFPAWSPDMFRFVPDLRTLGIGETPISVIPANAFIHTPNLMRLEMSEAAVDTIEPGAFQRTPMIQAIVLNKNRLTRVRADMFQGLGELYSLDLQGNRLEAVEPRGFANLAALRHLDISYNLLQSLPMDTFDGTFEPSTDDRRVIYACENPWLCDSQLEWFRQLLRDNLDIDIDKPGCVAACGPGMECPPEGTPLRALDFCPSQEGIPPPMPLAGTALSLVGWIILAAIMTVLLISICLMALLRYGMSHRRKKMKEQEIEDEQRIMSSAAASAYQLPSGFSSTLPRRNYATIAGGYGTGGVSFGSPIELDLPPAHNLDDRPNYFM